MLAPAACQRVVIANPASGPPLTRQNLPDRRLCGLSVSIGAEPALVACGCSCPQQVTDSWRPRQIQAKAPVEAEEEVARATGIEPTTYGSRTCHHQDASPSSPTTGDGLDPVLASCLATRQQHWPDLGWLVPTRHSGGLSGRMHCVRKRPMGVWRLTGRSQWPLKGFVLNLAL